jgi:hypothetical protein
MEQLPEGTNVTTTTDEPEAAAERYEWVPDEKKTFEELPADEVHERSKHVSRAFTRWTDKCRHLEDGKERDEQVREILLASDQKCIDFAIRFPHRFKHLTDSELIADPLMRRHQSAMLSIFDQRQRGDISENKAKQLVSQLAQRTIMDRTAALTPGERKARRAEMKLKEEASKAGRPID